MVDRVGSQPSTAHYPQQGVVSPLESEECYVSAMTFSLTHCELVTLLVTVGQLRPRLAAFDNVCQAQTTLPN